MEGNPHSTTSELRCYVQPGEEQLASRSATDQVPRGDDIEKNAPVESSTPSASMTTDQSEATAIDWSGPDDPELPLNWPRAVKWRNVLLVATLTLLTLACPYPREAMDALTSLIQTFCVVNVCSRHRQGYG